MSWSLWFKYYFQFAFNGVELRWVTPWFGLVIADGVKYYNMEAIWWGFDIQWNRNEYEEGGLLFRNYKGIVFREISLKTLYAKNLVSAYREGLL